MQFTDHNQEYCLVRVSDLVRDGMAMELTAVGQSKVLAEVFYSDTTGDFTISIFEPNVPLPVIEQLIGSARIALVPATRLHDR